MTTLTDSFLDETIDPKEFGHEQHVRVAYDLLGHFEFLDATVKYVGGIRSLAGRAGAPEKFHMTITLAFLSLIAERMAANDYDSFEEFINANDDLMSRNALATWYSSAHLDTSLAKEQFVLPKAS